jgi:hypothetical protein
MIVLVLPLLVALGLDVPIDVRNDLKAGMADTRRAAVKRAMTSGADAVKFVLPLAVNDKDGGVRDTAFTELTRLKTGDAVRAIVEHGVGSRDAKVRAIAVELLSVIEPPGVEDAIVRCLGDKDAAVRLAAAACAGQVKATAAAPELLRIVDEEKDPLLRSVAIESLSRLEVDGITAHLERWLDSPSESVQLTALHQFFWNDKVKGAAAAARFLESPALAADGPLRPLLVQAIEEARRYRDPVCLPGLVSLLEHPRARARDMAYQTLREVTGLEIPNTPSNWKQWLELHGGTFVPPAKDAVKAGLVDRSQVSFYGVPIVSDRVVFVLDFSGSMRESDESGRSKLDSARDALAEVLNALPDGTLFNVIAFSNEPKAWRESAQPKKPGNVDGALKFVRGMSAGGWTNVYDSLALALRMESIDTIVLLSDGAPSSGAFHFFSRIRHHVRMLNRTRKVAVSSIALKTSEDAKRFLRELAKDTGGDFVER